MQAALSLAKQASDLIKEQSYIQAIHRFNQSLAITQSSLSLYGIAYCYLCLKDYSNAISISLNALKDPGIFEDKVKLILAKSHEGLGEFFISFEYWKSITSSKNLELQDYSKKNLERLEKVLQNNEEYQTILTKNKETSEVCFIICKEWVFKWKKFLFNQGKHPGAVCNSHLIEKTVSDPRDYASVELKPNLLEDQDFILFSSSSFKIIKEKYSSDQDIKRFCIFHSHFSEYEITLNSLSVLFIPQVSSSFLQPFTFRYSAKESIQEVVSACKSLIESSFDHVSYNFDIFRVWKAEKNVSIVQPSEKLFIPSAEPVSSLSSTNDCLFLFEFQKADGNWTVFSQLESPCPNCLVMSELPVICLKCKTIQYCSKTCLEQHVFIHIPDCCEMLERNGKTGLGNLGNTCYMNSVLQCLAHTEMLKNYFLNKMFLHENQRNGLVTLAFAKLLFQLWGVNRGVVFPSEFKKSFCSKFSMFSGVSQHDSHEFLIHLLDSLNEELKNPENATGATVIGRNFYGTSETCLKCVDCGKLSYKEEGFLTLPLQVANLEKVQITLYVVFIDPSKDIGRRVVNCFFSWNTKELKELLENEFSSKILLCFYDMLEFRGEVKNTDIGDYIGKVLVAYQAPCEDYIICSFIGKLGKIMFDRVIFLEFNLIDELFNRIQQKIQEIFYLKFGNLDRLKSLKMFYNKEEIASFEEPLLKYSKVLKTVVEVNEKTTEMPKKFLELESINVALPLDYNLYTALKIMAQAEHLDEENKCFCEGCNRKTQMIKYFTIKQFPKVLIFQLLKFKNSLTKINTLVEFPVERLDLNDFGCVSAYELFATCNHFGSYSFGHYTANVKSDEAWFDFNDSIITSINQSQVVTSSAYLLFYIRKI